jgi:hypothetical protein
MTSNDDTLTELSRVAHLMTEEERTAAELLLKPTDREFLRTLPDDILDIAHEAAQEAEAAGRGQTWEQVIPYMPADLRERFAAAVARGYWQ